jgi:hypothetical protein
MLVLAAIVAVESNKYYIFGVSVAAFVIQHVMRICYIVICGLSGSIIIFHTTS